MRSYFARLIVLIAVITLQSTMKATAQEGAEVSFQVFYDELSPYGQWINDPNYGYAWVPDAGGDFRPYSTNGYWIMTGYGNTWYSMYPWGWAPFHYGRWIYDGYYGWIWIPGYEWGPAWVCWRYGGGYYGWAPLGPWFTVSVSFGDYYCPDNWWMFVSCHHLYYRHPRYHHRPRHHIRHTHIVRHTRVHNRATHVTGPLREEIRLQTGNEVPVYETVDASTPRNGDIRGNTVQMYRPAVSQAGQGVARPASTAPATRPIGQPKPVPAANEPGPAFRRERQPGVVTPPTERQKERPVEETRPSPRTQPRPVQQQPAPRTEPKPMQQKPAPRTEPRPVRQRPAPHTEPKPVPQSQPRPVRQQPAPRTEPRPVQQPRPAPRTEPTPNPRQVPPAQRK